MFRPRSIAESFCVWVNTEIKPVSCSRWYDPWKQDTPPCLLSLSPFNADDLRRGGRVHSPATHQLAPSQKNIPRPLISPYRKHSGLTPMCGGFRGQGSRLVLKQVSISVQAEVGGACGCPGRTIVNRLLMNAIWWWAQMRTVSLSGDGAADTCRIITLYYYRKLSNESMTI